MNIKRPLRVCRNAVVRGFVALGWLAAFSVAALPLRAGQIEGQVDYDGVLTPSGFSLRVVISTPSSNGGQELNRVSLSTAAFPASYSFSGLTENTTYWVWAFLDIDDNLNPNDAEPMGGMGPFPFFLPEPTYVGTVAESTKTYNFNLYDRGVISVNLTNTSAQSGVIILNAHPEPFVQGDENRVRRIYAGPGYYELEGLLPGVNYKVESYIDKSPFNNQWDPLEDKGESTEQVTVSTGTPPAWYGPWDVTITSANSQATGGAPNGIELRDEFGSSYQALVAGSTSTRLRLTVMDDYWRPTISTKATDVTFNVWGPSGNYAVDLSTNAGAFHFSTGTKQISIISASVSTSPYIQFVAPTDEGWYNLEAWADDFPETGNSRWAWYNFRVLSVGSGINITSFRTDSGTPEVDNAIPLTPNWDGSNDAMVLEFTSPSDLQWECVISTVNFDVNAEVALRPENVVARQGGWGWGGTNSVWWDGYNQNDDWRKVPNGTYYVRVQAAGGAVVSPVKFVNVETGLLGGVVKSGGSPVADVRVDCWGPNSGGYAVTDANGMFKIAGLTIGSYYTLNFSKAGYATTRLENKQASGGSGNNLGDITLGAGGTLQVNVAISTPPLYDVWGNVSVHDSNWINTGWGNVHVRAGTTTADNGRWYQDENNKDPEYATYTVVGMAPGDYTVEFDLPQYGRQTYPSLVTLGVNTTTYISFTATRKANVSGALTLPAPYAGNGGCSTCGDWISVDAVKSGSDQPSAWGGGNIMPGATSTTFRVDGLDPGTYVLRAYARGYKSQTKTITVGATDLTADFDTFQTGGIITGKVTVIGNSVGLGSQTSGGWTGGCGEGKFSVNVNAWSPNTYMGSYQQICVDESASSSEANIDMRGLDDGLYYIWTWLPGFQIEPPEMPKRVTVENGAGTANITFRQLSGVLNLSVSLPAGHPNPALVSYQLQSYGGGDSTSKSGVLGAGGTAQVTGLGTGFYSLNLSDAYSGLKKRAGLTVTNGRTTSLAVDMSVATKRIKGSVAVNGTISLITRSTDSLPTTVNVSSATGLYKHSTFLQYDTQAMQFNEMHAPRIQVFSLPLSKHSSSPPDPYFEANASTGDACIGLVASTTTDACFDFGGFVQGMYLVKVQEDLDPLPTNTNCPDCEQPGKPDLATTDKTVFINDANVTGVGLKVTNGVKLSGTISRPAGDTDTTVRTFTIKLRREDNSAVWMATAATTGVGTAAYEIPHLGEGDYNLELQEGDPFTYLPNAPAPKYTLAPKRITVGSSDLVQNLTLLQAGAIVGKLRDADSNTLITSRNIEQFIPDGFYINANANPWVPGGYGWTEWDMSHIKISSVTNQFAIYRLLPGNVFDVTARMENKSGGFSMSSAAQGKKAYSPVTKSGVRVAAGQTVDIGVLDLKQGVSVTGTVTDKNGTPLSNILVVARPSLQEGGSSWDSQIQAFTDADGKYTLMGIDRSQLYYDIIASPRFSSGDGSFFNQMSGIKYGEERIRMVDVTDDARRAGVNFSLTEASGMLVGRVVTVDGGTMSTPFGDSSRDENNRKAAVMLHLAGVPLADNPLGEIEEETDVMGNFQVNGLKPGSYTVRIISIGYASAKKNIVIQAGSNDIGTITLQKGATVSGKITKPNGSYPNSEEAGMVVGVDEDFEEFNFGNVETNETTKEVTGYKITGFKPGVTYALLMVAEEGNDIVLGKTGLTFASVTDNKTINLVYRPVTPAVYASQSRSGSIYTLRFFCTQKLRNLTADDNDLTKIVTLAAGGGQILYSSSTIGSSRDTISVVYSAPANERSFRLRLSFSTIKEDPDTGSNFIFAKEFKFYAGARRMRIVQIANLMGGEAMLQGDPTGSNYISGAFEVDRSSRVEVGVVSAASLDDLSAAPAAGPLAPAARAQSVKDASLHLGPEAYPSPELYSAVQMAPAVSPFSAFYDIFLPAGVNHQLKKQALLSLKYDDSVTDTAKLNVYYYDPNNNVFLIEKEDRVVDAVNKTITVGVNHASTFVVLNNDAAIVTGNTYNGTEILIHNFPNPFNLKPKTVNLSKSATTPSATVDGTMIRYALPAGKAGTVKFEIYNVAGELVRTITETAPTGGNFYYTEWNGRNDGGKQVASGVYLGRFTINGGDERFFKMAVLK